jgi:uncharacterized membrane protein
MNAAQIHLALNHFPVAGTMLAFAVLAWGFFAKKDQIKIVGVALALVSAVTTIIVLQSGEGAEEIVEHKPLVTESLIHEHEEAAEASMVAIQLTAVLGIAWLVMFRLKKDHQEKVFALMLITSIVSSGLIADAAHKGGQIRHDEIRKTASGPNAPSTLGESEEKEHEEQEK